MAPINTRATILVVPGKILPEDLGVIDGAAVGPMNPGLGEVRPDQTWLDVSQGARAFDVKYDRPLNTMLVVPPFVRGWEETHGSSPEPAGTYGRGLLASVLRRNGLLPAAAGSVPTGSRGNRGRCPQRPADRDTRGLSRVRTAACRWSWPGSVFRGPGRSPTVVPAAKC